MKAESMLLSALLALSAGSAGATPWHDFGPRAMGMGGAGVAVAQGPEAFYWNPGGLGQPYNTTGLAVPIGIRGEFTGTVLQGANDVYQVSEDCKRGDPKLCTSQRFNEAHSRLHNPGNGAQVDFGGGVGVKIKRLVVFAFNETYMGVTSKNLDITNTNICYPVVTANCVWDNKSSLALRGGNFTELGVGYGQEIKETGLSIGGNLKGISGKVGYAEFRAVADKAGGGSFGKFKDNTKTSFQPAVDLGLLWDMRETWSKLPWRPRVGLVGRNINGPRFSQPDGAKGAGERDKYTLQGQVRMGAALSPFKFWHVAADLDMTKNNTDIDGCHSRYLSLGTEIDIFNRTWINIPLRAGLKKNLSDTGSGAAYTAGVGLNLAHVIFDLGLQVSAKRTTIESEGEQKKVRNNAAAAFRFAVLFGGKDEGPRNKPEGKKS
ncbi:MAG: conjugal transfer protein TraF [Elusimicrobia bacterium]|nr:conjugal transfer protein TraF [Elusimicrobiota bacterium]